MFLKHLKAYGMATKTRNFTILGEEGGDSMKKRTAIDLAAIPVNEYGNADVRYGAPSGYAHVPGQRLATACKAIGIECVPALVGFDKKGGRYRPETDGVVVSKADEKKLREYLQQREARKAKSEPARQRATAKRSLERERLAESLGVQSDSRTFEAFMRGDIDADEARRIGRITSRRHEETNYDELLREGFSKQEARELMTPKLSALPKAGRIPLATARKALKLLPPGRKACGITAQSLREGMEVEREHSDVTKLGLKKTALIAAAHLCEARRYYPELKKMERKLKRRK